MISTTTPSVDGKQIVEYKQIVFWRGNYRG
ncbi:hypothetical protein PCORN_05056 [Listeria cornellensis FSL F6-0969]|uniref:Uncharacterized protein n=1 Tax=Listeria cornellensis FSL F6-0969 TaxID=1265820 RepID=W7CF38_9LIST|nr:hypothetical protein PCORN_05056 [Listeria cornellensis FSL F6-0969]